MVSRLKTMGLSLVFAALLGAVEPGEFIISYESAEVEPNDTRLSAGWLLEGVGAPPSFWMDADRDYYRLMIMTIPTTLTVNVEGVAGNDPAVQIEDQGGGLLAVNQDIAPDNPNCFLEYVFFTTGTYYVAVWAQNFNPAATGYRLFGEYVQRDDEPPTYTTVVGIQNVERDGMGSAIVEWGAAVDNFTPPEQILYGVYVSTSLDQLFAPPPLATFTGVTSGTVSGLDPKEYYYFAVRASDQQGNEETNEVYIFAPIRLGVNPANWALYE